MDRSSNTFKYLILSLGPLLFLLVLRFSGLELMQAKVLACLAWMLVWWMSNYVPLGITALLPIVLFPLLGILDPKTVGALYGHPIIFLFLGGFALGLAIEKWNLHRRIALNILNLSGTKPSQILMGMMISTALLSMWISNTATTVMMLPIGMSIYALLKDKLPDAKGSRNFAIALMLGIAYSANVGGMSTLIGTPPNLVLASFSSSSLGRELAFADWILFALPLCIVLLGLLWFLLSKILFPSRIKIAGLKELLKKEIAELGSLKNAERRTALVLATMALLWIFRSPLNRWSLLEHLSDTIIAVLGMIALFVIPFEKGAKQSLLNSKDIGKLPWNIILLFGGGLSIAKGMEVSKLVEALADLILQSPWQQSLVIILIITAFSIFLTEVMSNVALVSVFVPVSFIIAKSLGFSELSLAIPLTLGASCAFMFPIATPPNAIVYSSGLLRTQDMAKAGIWFNLISLLLIAVYSYFLVPLLFNSI